MQWYVLRVASNKEEQVREALSRKAEREDLKDIVGRIEVPFEQVKRIDKTQSLERLVLAGELVVCVFDIERGDIIWQEHHLVGEQLLAVHPFQIPFRHTA